VGVARLKESSTPHETIILTKNLPKPCEFDEKIFLNLAISTKILPKPCEFDEKKPSKTII